MKNKFDPTLSSCRHCITRTIPETFKECGECTRFGIYAVGNFIPNGLEKRPNFQKLLKDLKAASEVGETSPNFAFLRETDEKPPQCENECCTCKFLDRCKNERKHEYLERAKSRWINESPTPHYSKIAAASVEPIILMEAINSREQIPPTPRTNLVLAQKHLSRVGEKGDWWEDAKKALNYLHRALTGKWPTE